MLTADAYAYFCQIKHNTDYKIKKLCLNVSKDR